MIFHQLTEVDTLNKTAICSVCGPTKISIKGKTGKRMCYSVAREHRRKYRKTSKVYKMRERGRRKAKVMRLREAGVSRGRTWKYRKHVGRVCSRCGYEAVHPCLIDGHHRDGNRKNNKPDNIASLCAICHRIEHLPEEVKKDLVVPALVPVVKAEVVAPAASANVVALLDNVEELTNKVAELEGKLFRCSRASEDEKFRVLLFKYDKMAIALAKYENDGSVG